MSIQNIISKTREYLGVPAVVRFEQQFMNYLADDFNISGYGVEKQDKILVVRKKGIISPKIITAHIDRHGITVNDEGKFEYAAFNARKYYGDEIESPERVFKKIGKAFIDETVYAYDKEGKVLEEGQVKDSSYDFNVKDVFFEINGFGKLPTGTPIAYASSLTREEGNISSQIDNVISVAVAYQLVQDGFDGTLIFAAEEEIGRSWQYITNYLESQESASQEIITLDTTPYGNTRAVSEGLIVFRNKDENGEFNPDLVKRLRSVCDNQGIKYEMKDEVIEAKNAQLPKDVEPEILGKTELGRIVQHTDSRFNGATIQLPTTEYHSNHETTSELALSNYYEALKKLLL